MTGYIIFMVVVLAVVFTIAAMVGKKRRDKLLSEGKIIMRKGDFYKNEQFFKSYINDQQAFFSALTAAARNTGICSVSGDYSSTVVYKGKTWTARLARHKPE